MWLIVLSVACQLGAVILLKLFAQQDGEQAYSLLRVLLHPYFWLALLCLAGQAFTWQLVLRRYPLSFAYPFNGLIYPGALLVGTLFFAEPVSAAKLLGVALIIGGVWVMSREQSA
jgi:multidrug transporter EmrE-like cation transporter